jgi:plasmid maintenance system antidote protein VapI
MIQGCCTPQHHQAVISRIENGTVNIGIDFVDRLARAFGKRVELRMV